MVVSGTSSPWSSCVRQSKGQGVVATDPKLLQAERERTCPKGCFEDANIDKITARASILSALAKEGRSLAAFLYSWRSCPKSFPAAGEDNGRAIAEAAESVLRPMVQQLVQVEDHCGRAVKAAMATIHEFHDQDRQTAPAAILLGIGQLLDTLLALDTVKNMKPGVLNDFSYYKRTLQSLRMPFPLGSGDSGELDALHRFLSTRNVMMTSLKERLATSLGAEDVLYALVDLASNQCLSNPRSPEEKHRSYRMMVAAFWLADGLKGGNPCRPNMFKAKRVNLTRVLRLIRVRPVVLLIGDTYVSLVHMLQSCPNYDQTIVRELVELPVDKPTQFCSLGLSYAGIKSEVDTVLTDVALARLHAECDPTSPRLADIGSLILKALQLLSSASSLLLDSHAWKLSHPSTVETQNGRAVADYERAVRYNYSYDEYVLMVRLVGLVKETAAALNAVAADCTAAIGQWIYREVTKFSQNVVTDAINYCHKKKRRKELIKLLGQINGLLVGPGAFIGLGGGGCNERAASMSRFFDRGAVLLMQVALETARTIGSQELQSEHIRQIEAFSSRLDDFACLLQLPEMISRCSDLGRVWYREFFLDFSVQTDPQLPISMSLPWLATQHALELSHSLDVEFLPHTLALYNDAACYCLSFLRCQHLVDEIRAEAQLAVEQVVFWLAHMAHHHCAIAASSTLIDKGYKRDLLLSSFKKQHLNGKASALLVPAATANWELVGHTVDVGLMVGRVLSVRTRSSLEAALARFESGDLLGIMELEGLLQNIELAHSLAGKHFPVDSFQDLLEGVVGTEAPSRVGQHALMDIAAAIMPSFCYHHASHRFIRTVLAFSPVDSKESRGLVHVLGSKAFVEACEFQRHSNKDILTPHHLGALVRLLRPADLPVLTMGIIDAALKQVKDVLVPQVQKLRSTMPAQIKRPAHAHSSPAVFEYYRQCLQGVMLHRELRTEVLHAFRQLGNAVLLLIMLTEAVEQETLYRAQKTLQGTQGKDGSADGRATPMDVDNKPTLAKDALERLQKGLMEVTDWYVSEPQSLAGSGPEGLEFYQVWSAIHFATCVPQLSSEPTHEELYGEGLQWGGLCAVWLLGQQHRLRLVDYAGHVLSAHMADGKDQMFDLISVRSFCLTARYQQIRTQRIVATLDRLMGPPVRHMLPLHPRPKV
eukprot:comp22774_c0_seq1/m.35621 comp22774_c0_seq1/g.35621  ORF comp22774_c0_seq1/g.35621 comp22774_c0_seq1/m.35621 type:complete len:1163 (-) comp22774_c0_seq1:216-3704(-)